MTEKAMVIRTMDDAERAAKAMSASGFFKDTASAAQAVVKILAGQELGFGPFASMTGVSIIQGKPTVGANLLAAAVKSSGKYNYRVIEMTDAVCEIAFHEDGKETGRSRFTMEDAKKANLTGKDNWTKYPRNMLFARAISNGQRWFAPDVFNGALVYTPDEMGANTDEDGNFIDIKATDITETEPKKVEPEDKPQEVLDAEALLTSDGKTYGSLTTAQLSFRANSMSTKLNDPAVSEEYRVETIKKLAATRLIIDWRASH